MATEFRLPDIGEGLTEAEIVRWLIPVGGTVAIDEPLVEVETDKAVVDLPAPVAGTVLHHGAPAGEVLEVGAILAVIGEAGEAWPPGDTPAPPPPPVAATTAPAPAPAAPPSPPPAPGGPDAAPLVGTLDDAAEQLPARPATVSAPAARVQALPLVRRLAREKGIDLATVAGTGPQGRITRQDVEAVAAGPPAATAPAPAASAPARSGDERVRMSRLRRTIAERMTASWTQIPHVTTFDAVDASRLLEARAALARRHGVPIPIEALVVKAVIPALEAFPDMNASIDGDDVVYHHRHDIGVAVDTPEGLMVPVVRAAGTQGVLDLSAEIVRLSEAAADRSLTVEELQGATFTVSNIGALGGGYGTPIVPPGTTGILSVGRAAPTPVVRDGAIVAAPMLPLSLSYDHRLIDGGAGRRFMALVLENLAEPALFLV